jgi:hypothetical protein
MPQQLEIDEGGLQASLPFKIFCFFTHLNTFQNKTQNYSKF